MMTNVRVKPYNYEKFSHLRHPVTHQGFSSGTEVVEWPYDQFTIRRIRDKDVVIAKPAEEAPAPMAKPSRKSQQ